MPGPQPPSRQSSVSSNNAAVDAALLGAATAFGRPAAAQGGPSNTIIARGSNGSGRDALAAAATAHIAQHTGPGPHHNKSASQQAAVLASSRVRPSAAGPAVAPKPRRLSGHREVDNPTDITPIPRTTSLVDLFEQKSKAKSDMTAIKPDSIVLRHTKEPPVKSPKPKLLRSGITSLFQLELEESSSLRKSPSTRDTDGVENDFPKQGEGDENSSEDSFASASEDLNAESPGNVVTMDNTRLQSQSPGSARSALKMQNEAKRRPLSVTPLHNTVSRPLQVRRPSTVSREAFPTSSSLSAKSIQAQYKQAYPRPERMTPLTTGDQLADALVASSLASSRAPSPTRWEPPPLPARRRKNRHHHNVLGFSRTPSPSKAGMLHTLRPQESSSESESETELHPYGKHKKKALIRKHPNKHHEGDRKRWRDAVTERERKRYEGVWAANKGIHCSFTPQEEQSFQQAPNSEITRETLSAANDQVSNVIARDIWNRSRLPGATLETVWDLVDHDVVGRLSREEFVVGMWLIDQRLKGRKLPVKVTESVWASVMSLQGIKIRK